MLKSREDLNKHFENVITRYVNDPYTIKQIADYCYEHFNMPRSRTQTILNLGATSLECTESEIFWILTAMNNINDRWHLSISQYYTDTEINVYLNNKSPEQKIKLPLFFDMIQIADDQWIGKITARELIALRRADKITYNKSAQRRAKTIVRGEKDIVKINVIVSVVNKISKLLTERKFISNAITLNIPDGAAEYYYDNKTKQLVITELRSFDIIDGFHRYVAMCNVADNDPDFDYPMELRLVAFSDEKANNFIWQEEQKTKMSLVDAKSYNMNDLANKIANRIAESSICSLSGIIDRNGKLPISFLANAIDNVYIKNIDDEEKKTAIVNITKELIEDFNILTDNDPALLTKVWRSYNISSCICLFYFYRNKDKRTLYDTFVSVNKYIHDNKLETTFDTNRSTKKQMQIIEALLEAK